jgi:hypothetical protein
MMMKYKGSNNNEILRILKLIQNLWFSTQFFFEILIINFEILLFLYTTNNIDWTIAEVAAAIICIICFGIILFGKKIRGTGAARSNSIPNISHINHPNSLNHQRVSSITSTTSNKLDNNNNNSSIQLV